jgi:hypothetical protein
MAFFVKIEFCLFHSLLMLFLELFDLLCMFGVQCLNLISDSIVTLDFKVNLILMVLLELLNFFFVTFFLVLEFISELLMLFEGVLNVRVFYFFVGLKGQLVLFL